jgi:hypothetical protein
MAIAMSIEGRPRSRHTLLLKLSLILASFHFYSLAFAYTGVYNFTLASTARLAASLPALRPNTAPAVSPLPPG